MNRVVPLILLFAAFSAGPLFAQTMPSKVPPRLAAWKDDAWLGSDAGRQAAANVLTWQNADGGWPKNYDASTIRPAFDNDPHEFGSTIDNGGTYSELRLLARAYTLDPKPQYKAAFDKGLKWIFDAQYANGGWPQRFPIEPKNYSRYVTFNDGAILGTLRLLEAIKDNKPEFALVSEADRTKAKAAFDKGIDCILHCQLKDSTGALTGWCQQYDEKTLTPTGARAFELPGVSASESAGLAMLLMSQAAPDDRMKQAIVGVKEWFNKVKIVGKRFDDVRGQQYENGYDRILIDDPTSTVWARYYEIDTNRPFFCGRDGIKRYDLKEVEHERRTGYAWYGKWPARALTMYEEWDQRGQ